MSEQLIQYWKIGKLKMDMGKLDNFDKVQYAKIESLINYLIKFHNDIHKAVRGEQDEKSKPDNNKV